MSKKKDPIKRLQEIAKKKKWNRIEPMELEVPVTLSEGELAQRGKELGETMDRIQELEQEKKDQAAAINEKIRREIEGSKSLAGELRTGIKVVDKTCPGFYAPELEERVYLDPDSEEIVYKAEKQPGDEQVPMANAS